MPYLNVSLAKLSTQFSLLVSALATVNENIDMALKLVVALPERANKLMQFLFG